MLLYIVTYVIVYVTIYSNICYSIVIILYDYYYYHRWTEDMDKELIKYFPFIVLILLF